AAVAGAGGGVAAGCASGLAVSGFVGSGAGAAGACVAGGCPASSCQASAETGNPAAANKDAASKGGPSRVVRRVVIGGAPCTFPTGIGPDSPARRVYWITSSPAAAAPAFGRWTLQSAAPQSRTPPAPPPRSRSAL